MPRTLPLQKHVMPRTLPVWKPVMPNVCSARTRAQRAQAQERYEALLNDMDALEARLEELHTWTPGQDIHLPNFSTLTLETHLTRARLTQCQTALQGIIDTGALDAMAAMQ
jgi:hypothetical protein